MKEFKRKLKLLVIQYQIAKKIKFIRLKDKFFLLTIHRFENVNNKKIKQNI